MKRVVSRIVSQRSRWRPVSGSSRCISVAIPSMTAMGFLRSCDTVLTKSFFISSSVLRSVTSRTMAVSPTGSPKPVITGTRSTWAVRPPISASSTVPG